METKTAHLITGTRADVVEALTRMIMEKNPNAGEITFLELPERADFRALAEEPVVQEAAPLLPTHGDDDTSGYTELKRVAVKAMDEIGKVDTKNVMELFRVRSLDVARGNPSLIAALTAALQIARFVRSEDTDLYEEATKAAVQMNNAFVAYHTPSTSQEDE